jgi:CBS domain-containing protein
MNVGEYLQRAQQRLVTCKPDDAIETVAKLLDAHAIGAMPVCEPDGRMVGIISERDLVRTLATRGDAMRKMRVTEVMTKRVVSCGPDSTMQAAQDLMRNNRFRHLPVVAAGQVVGILSIRDTLATRLKESELEINVLRDIVVAARSR